MNIARSTLTLVLSCLAATFGARALAQDWPQWRGPARDGKVSVFKAPKAWPKELARKWKEAVGQGDATPALVGDKLFVFTRQGASEVIRCMEAASGKEVWKDSYEAQGAVGASGSHPGPRSSPAVADGKVVTLGVRGTLSCLEASSGKKLWRKDDFTGAWPMFFTSSSPIIVGGLCIAQLGGRDNGAIVAYDLSSGEQKWKSSGDSPAYASPALLTIGGNKLIVAETERRVVAVAASDGKLAWETPFAPQGRGYNAASVIVDGQTLFLTGSERGVTALKLEKEGDKIASKELWSNKDNSVQFSTPVLKDGLLFGLTQNNDFFCIDTRTGKTAWTAKSGSTDAGGGGQSKKGGRRGMGGGRGGYGSIVDAGASLLALTPGSELVVFQPGAKEYKEEARIKVAETPTYAHPVVSENRIFIKDEDSLTLWTTD